MATLAMPRVLPAKEISESSKQSLSLLQGGADDSITGRTDFSSKNGKSSFRLRIKGGPSSAELELKVGGVSHGTFTTSKSGSANLQFKSGSSSGKSHLLDFDPRGELIEIEDIGDDKLLTSNGSDDSRSVNENSNLTSTGVQPGASGHASLRQKKGAAQFNVEIESVTDGAYDVIVDGVTRGTITATGGRGEIQFGDDNGGPALDFDPLAKLIQISQTGTVILSGSLLAGAPGVSVCTPAETTSVLTNLGLDPDASGSARLRIRDDCRRDFRVEVESLTDGAYDLFVAGLLRSSITVTGGLGEVEFSSSLDDSPSGELPLDFDPAGQTIEIKQGTNVFLNATGGTTTTGTCTAADTQLDMTNTGADADAKGKSRFRQDAGCERNFRVEVEKLSVGNYDLVVGGITRGTIAVALVLGDEVGEIEFETSPGPGQLVLTFDPRGQLVEVKQGATVFLNVTMPN